MIRVQEMFEQYASNKTQIDLLSIEDGYIELSCAILDDMPKGSGLSDPVNRTITNAIYNRKEIQFVELLIHSRLISDDERFVLQKKYCEKLAWKDILNQLQNRNNCIIHINTIKKMNIEALKKLQNWVDQQPRLTNINRYNFDKILLDEYDI
jgi:hypothetical protein